MFCHRKLIRGCIFLLQTNLPEGPGELLPQKSIPFWAHVWHILSQWFTRYQGLTVHVRTLMIPMAPRKPGARRAVRNSGAAWLAGTTPQGLSPQLVRLRCASRFSSWYEYTCYTYPLALRFLSFSKWDMNTWCTCYTCTRRIRYL